MKTGTQSGDVREDIKIRLAAFRNEEVNTERMTSHVVMDAFTRRQGDRPPRGRGSGWAPQVSLRALRTMLPLQHQEHPGAITMLAAGVFAWGFDRSLLPR